jgi:hypothetical protein
MSFDQKDEMTETLRYLIKKRVSVAIETNRAEVSLCSLSFQGRTARMSLLSLIWKTGKMAISGIMPLQELLWGL